MNVLVNAMKIEFLKKLPKLVHAISPRYYKTEDGKTEELNPATVDDERVLRLHRRWFLRSLGINADDFFRVKQMHGDKVYVLRSPAENPETVSTIEADAIVTDLRHRPIAVVSADCIPIIIYDAGKHVAGVVHAGRKGTEKRIFSNTIKVLVDEFGCQPNALMVGMGPGIGPCCYEVDEPCLRSFQTGYPDWQGFVSPSRQGKFMLDLFKANREDGCAAGIPPENISSTAPCTSCENDRWYSYRREGTTGRMFTLAMLR